MTASAYKKRVVKWGGLGLFLAVVLPPIVIALSRIIGEPAYLPASFVVLFGRFGIPLLVALIWTLMGRARRKALGLSWGWGFVVYPCALMAASQATSLGFRLTNGFDHDIFRSWPSVWPVLVLIGFIWMLSGHPVRTAKWASVTRVVLGVIFAAVAWIFLLSMFARVPGIGPVINVYISATDWMTTGFITVFGGALGFHPFILLAALFTGLWRWPRAARFN